MTSGPPAIRQREPKRAKHWSRSITVVLRFFWALGLESKRFKTAGHSTWRFSMVYLSSLSVMVCTGLAMSVSLAVSVPVSFGSRFEPSRPAARL